jgi:predicted phage-related endonuclease
MSTLETWTPQKPLGANAVPGLVPIMEVHTIEVLAEEPDRASAVDCTDLANDLATLRMLNLKIAEMNDEVARRRAVIEERLGEEHEIGLVAGKPAVTWRKVHSNRFEVARFRKAHPALAETFLKPSETRRFILCD